MLTNKRTNFRLLTWIFSWEHWSEVLEHIIQHMITIETTVHDISSVDPSPSKMAWQKLPLQFFVQSTDMKLLITKKRQWNIEASVMMREDAFWEIGKLKTKNALIWSLQEHLLKILSGQWNNNFTQFSHSFSNIYELEIFMIIEILQFVFEFIVSCCCAVTANIWT